MAQMGYVGPMIGQHHQFHHFNPGKSKFGEDKFFEQAKRISPKSFIKWKYFFL